jgi:hypothetical protein
VEADRASGQCAGDFVPEGGVTPAAVTNADLELRLYDPNAKSVRRICKQPPTGFDRADWGGRLAFSSPDTTKIRRRQRRGGQRTDPPNLWTGVCQTPVAATLRDKNNYVDLTGLRASMGDACLRLPRRPPAGEAGRWHVARRRLWRGRHVEQLHAVLSSRVRGGQCPMADARTSRASSRAASRTWRSRI